MKTLLRSFGLLAVGALLFPLSVASADVATVDAAAFIGSWAFSLEGGPAGSIPLTVDVTDDEGNVAVKVAGGLTVTSVTEIAKDGEDLSMSLSIDGQDGMECSGKLVLTPNPGALKATLDVGDGAYMLSGTGTKK